MLEALQQYLKELGYPAIYVRSDYDSGDFKTRIVIHSAAKSHKDVNWSDVRYMISLSIYDSHSLIIKTNTMAAAHTLHHFADEHFLQTVESRVKMIWEMMNER